MGMKQILNFKLQAFPSTSAWRAVSPTNPNSGWSSAGVDKVPWPVSGVARRLWIKCATAIRAGQTYVVALEVNGSASALTCTLSEGMTEASDLEHEVALSAGDTVALWVDPLVTSAAELEAVSWQFESDDTVSSAYGGSGGSVYTSAKTQALLFPCYATWSDSGAYYDVVPLAGTVTSLRVRTTANAGYAAGSGHTFTIVKNGVAQDGTGGTPNTSITLLYTTRSGSATFSLPVSPGDKVWLAQTPVGASPGSTYPVWGVAFASDLPYRYLVTHLELGTLYNTYGNSFYGYRNGWAGLGWYLDFGPDPVTFSDFRMVLSGPPGAGDALTFTLEKNGVPTGLSVSISEAATEGVNNTESVSCAPGDRVRVVCTTTGSPDTSVDQYWAAVAFSELPPDPWVPVANYVEQEIPASAFPGGAARVLGDLWTEDTGSPLPVVKARLYNVTDGASAGESAEVSSATPTACDFGVTLASGTKRYTLQVTSDTPDIDIFYCGRGVGP